MKRWLLALLLLAGPASAGEVVMMGYGAVTGAPVTQILAGSSPSLASGTTGNFFIPGTHEPLAQTVVASVHAIVLAGTIRDLYFTSGNTALTAGTVAVTVFKCPARTSCAATALTCTLTADSSTRGCSDTSNSFHVDEGDSIYLQVVPTSTNASVLARWGMRWTGDNNDEFMLHGGRIGNNSATTMCMPIGGVAGTQANGACATFPYAHMPIPMSGTKATGLYVWMASALSAGCQRVTVMVDGTVTDTSLQRDMTSAEGTYATDVTGEINLPSGTLLGIQIDPSSSTCGSTGSTTPTNPYVNAMIRMVNTSHKSILQSCSSAYLTTTPAQFIRPVGPIQAPQTVANMAANAATPLPAFTALDFFAKLSAAPGTGAADKGYTHSISYGGTPTVGIGCTVANSASVTTCSGSGSNSVSAGSAVQFQTVAGATAPTASAACLSVGIQ